MQSFFGDYLTSQRDLSPNTLLSYRDALKLFLAFAARHHHKRVVDLGFEHVGPQTILAFLDHLETSRGNAVRTRNARLAALHPFFGYVGAHEPQVLDLCQRIRSIPVKKSMPTRVTYLEYDEVLQILRSIDLATPVGRRDHLLVRLLFETGARAQEIASLRTRSLHLAPPYQVRLLGKGRKERICPRTNCLPAKDPRPIDSPPRRGGAEGEIRMIPKIVSPRLRASAVKRSISSQPLRPHRSVLSPQRAHGLVEAQRNRRAGPLAGMRVHARMAVAQSSPMRMLWRSCVPLGVKRVAFFPLRRLN